MQRKPIAATLPHYISHSAPCIIRQHTPLCYQRPTLAGYLQIIPFQWTPGSIATSFFIRLPCSPQRLSGAVCVGVKPVPVQHIRTLFISLDLFGSFARLILFSLEIAFTFAFSCTIKSKSLSLCPFSRWTRSAFAFAPPLQSRNLQGLFVAQYPKRTLVSLWVSFRISYNAKLIINIELTKYYVIYFREINTL